MATIKDVARKAGVSISTVSRVLNGTAPISQETRERVLRAVDELDFHPNALARGLVTRRSKVVGLLISDITNPFYPEVVCAVEEAAATQGYEVILGNTRYDDERSRKFARTLIERQVDGVIVMTNRITTETLAKLAGSVGPTVVFDIDVDDLAAKGLIIDAVLLDFSKTTRIATTYLASLGHSRVGFVSGPCELETALRRKEGFLSGMQQAGLEIDGSLIEEGKFTLESGYEAMERVFARVDRLPTAIVAANDMMALGAMRAIWSRGLSVPEDISVVGVDDIAFAQAFKPALTTVALPRYEIGVEAVRLFIKAMKKSNVRRRKPMKVYLEPTLIVRESTAPPRT